MIHVKYCIVTGRSSEIGYEICNKFKSNYKIINLSRSKCNIDGVYNISIDLTQKLDENEIENKLIKNMQYV